MELGIAGFALCADPLGAALTWALGGAAAGALLTILVQQTRRLLAPLRARGGRGAPEKTLGMPGGSLPETDEDKLLRRAAALSTESLKFFAEARRLHAEEGESVSAREFDKLARVLALASRHIGWAYVELKGAVDPSALPPAPSRANGELPKRTAAAARPHPPRVSEPAPAALSQPEVVTRARAEEPPPEPPALTPAARSDRREAAPVDAEAIRAPAAGEASVLPARSEPGAGGPSRPRVPSPPEALASPREQGASRRSAPPRVSVPAPSPAGPARFVARDVSSPLVRAPRPPLLGATLIGVAPAPSRREVGQVVREERVAAQDGANREQARTSHVSTLAEEAPKRVLSDEAEVDGERTVDISLRELFDAAPIAT